MVEHHTEEVKMNGAPPENTCRAALFSVYGGSRSETRASGLGASAHELIQTQGFSVVSYALVPDEVEQIKMAQSRLARQHCCDILFIMGGKCAVCDHYEILPVIYLPVEQAAAISCLSAVRKNITRALTEQNHEICAAHRRYHAFPPVFSFVSVCSGMGKTTLLEKLIARLVAKGYRVGAVKHDAHRFEIDRAGKDSYRFTHAGAEKMVIASVEKLAMVQTLYTPRALPDILPLFYDMDIVLVEGYHSSIYPKIEVHRRALGDRLLCKETPGVLAVASDEPLALEIPCFDLNHPDFLIDLIIKLHDEMYVDS